MPTPVRTPKARTVRRIPPVRRNIQPKIVHSVRRRRRRRRSPSPITDLRSSHSSNSSSSSSSSSRSSRSHSHKHKRSKKRRNACNLRSNCVMPLYGTNGTMIVGYVRPCRTGVRLCHRNDLITK
uniref:Bm9103 n=1 Tax=Brugia malayi TaxID=6279 RepID=A0A0H5S3K2_BRUMA|nr:Bm9103 [Brugia malayi]